MPRPLAILILAALLQSCDDGPLAPIDGDLVAQRDAWQALGIDDYDWIVRYTNMWVPSKERRVEVRNGVVQRCVELETNEEVLGFEWLCPTVDELFGIALDLQASEDDWTLRLKFDARRAYIRAVAADVPGWADEEFYYSTEQLIRR